MHLADIDTDIGVETDATAIAELRRRRHDLEHAHEQIRILLGALRTRIELVKTVRAARRHHAPACERLGILLAALPGLETPLGEIDHELRAEVDLDGGLRLGQIPHADPHLLDDEAERLLAQERRLAGLQDGVAATIDQISLEICRRYRTTT